MRIFTYIDWSNKVTQCHYPNGGGYESLPQMQRELCSRFPHRNPVKISNGVIMDGDMGTVQAIVWDA